MFKLKKFHFIFVGLILFLACTDLFSQTDGSGLVERLKSPDVAIRRNAIDQFAIKFEKNPEKLSETTLLAISKALSDPDQDVREHAAGALYTIAAFSLGEKMTGKTPYADLAKYPDIKDALMKALADPSGKVRSHELIWALVFGYGPTPEIEAFFLKRLEEEPSGRVRNDILGALGENSESFGRKSFSRSPTIVAAFIKALKDKETSGTAALAIKDFTPPPPEALPILVEGVGMADTVRDKQYFLSAFLGAIVAYGKSAEGYLPELKNYLAKTKDESSRKMIQGAIAGIEVATGSVPLKEIAPIPTQRQVILKVGEKKQLIYVGVFANGIQRDLKKVAAGTTYQSSDLKVAIVDSEGIVRGISKGQATITVRNKDLQYQTPVTVEGVP